jgi:uncharacterized protein YndB with AHSA1/START domain
MLAKIAIGLAAVLGVLAIVIATRPAAFRVQRTAVIAAPPEVVFEQLDDLHRWGAWNPFERGDPTTRLTFSGPARGLGSSYHFAGRKMGEGRMTIAELRPREFVGIRADFIKPMAATHRIEFTLAPVRGGTSLTWAMSGRNGFLGKAVSLFVGMDRMVGGEFEKGLADLKRISEARAATAVAAR